MDNLGEREGPIPPQSVVIIQRFLGDRRFFHKISDERERPSVLRQYRTFTDKLAREERTDLAIRLIAGCGRDNDFWDVDRRDGAITLLQTMFEGSDAQKKFDVGKIKDRYVQVVSNIPATADPFGSAYSILEAGKIIFPHIWDERDRREVIKAVTMLPEKFVDDPSYNIVNEQAAAISQIKRNEEEEEKLVVPVDDLDDIVPIGIIVRRIREAQGKSQRELVADDSTAPAHSTLSPIERGGQVPSLNTLTWILSKFLSDPTWDPDAPYAELLLTAASRELAERTGQKNPLPEVNEADQFGYLFGAIRKYQGRSLRSFRKANSSAPSRDLLFRVEQGIQIPKPEQVVEMGALLRNHHSWDTEAYYAELFIDSGATILEKTWDPEKVQEWKESMLHDLAPEGEVFSALHTS